MPDDPKHPKTASAEDHSTIPALLVVDDDPAMLLSLEAVLEAHGIRISKARDGSEGLMVFRKHLPAVVLTDILMPEQDGISVIMAMRRERPDVKIIAMSGAGRIGNSDFLSVARKLGADAVMSKPLDMDELLATLRRYLPPR